MKNKTLYKFLRTGLKSDNGKNRDWVLNEWRKEEKLEMCKSGFYASKTSLQALNYVKGEIIAKVEVKGKSIIQEDKECWSEMQIVKAWHWTKNDSVELAIFAAEQVIDIYEKKCPADKHPRNAIESAKRYLKNLNEESKNAADAAAYAADAAANAADAAANAADAADARKVITKKIDTWFLEKLKTLKVYE